MKTPLITDATEARESIKIMLGTNSRETVIEWICAALNVAEASIDDDGDVWVGAPMYNHLSEDRLVDLVNTINSGV
jgi:hypothetical protein